MASNEVAQRRAKVAMLLLLGLDRDEVCRRVDVDRRTMLRDVAAIRAALDGGSVAPNVDATEVTLRELDRMGRVEDVDRAKVQMLRSLSRAVDDEPYNAALWRQYREALNVLLEVDVDADDDLAAAVAEIAGGTALGD